jgi:TIR domain/Pentapeptide repeats (8 copies)
VANEQQLNLVAGPRDHWNEWRLRNPLEKPDLRGAHLSNHDFRGFNLGETDFRDSLLRECRFDHARLTYSIFADADVSGARFKEAHAEGVDFSGCDLSRASFYKATLIKANFTGANLFRTAFRAARCRDTVFADVDLETALGLDEVNHIGRSPVSIDTLYRSSGNIPKVFLLGTGLPEVFVDYVPSLVEASAGIRFHSCFISYSHLDEPFARRLWARMRQEGIRVWFAPEEMQGGEKLFDQIERAIHMHDKLVLVLSNSSIRSNWVETELRKALQPEQRDRGRKLFPIRLVDMETIRQWKCPDADSGKDLATEVREYYIPDFSHWLVESEFEKEFAKLRRDLRTGGVVMNPWHPDNLT